MVPVPGPGSVFWDATCFPLEHRMLEGYLQKCTEGLQLFFRSIQNALALNDAEGNVFTFQMLGQTDLILVAHILQGWIGDHLVEGGQHLPRGSGEQDVLSASEKVQIQSVQMMGHVLEENDLSIQKLEHILHGHLPVAFHLGHDGFRRRMPVLGRGVFQVVTVEWFVHHTAIASLSEGVHQGSRDVAGTGPEENALRRGLSSHGSWLRRQPEVVR